MNQGLQAQLAALGFGRQAAAMYRQLLEAHGRLRLEVDDLRMRTTARQRDGGRR